MTNTPESEVFLFGIQRMRFLTDGPGVRTLVCTMDCPLRCRYCLNARSWDGSIRPGSFSVRELMDAVRIDDLYFRATGGGITFSGGEPLLHPAFLREFARSCPDDWDLRIETSLCVPRENLALCEDVFSYFYVDIKSMDPEIYRRYTGGAPEAALGNLKYLLSRRGPEAVTVRLPLIPGFNSEEDRQRSADALRALGVTKLDLFTYIVPEDSRA